MDTITLTLDKSRAKQGAVWTYEVPRGWTLEDAREAHRADWEHEVSRMSCRACSADLPLGYVHHKMREDGSCEPRAYRAIWQ